MTSEHKRRWYDNDPGTARFVETIQVFPDQVQSVICESIVGLADLEFKANELLQNYKSIGREKLMHLYGSQHKRRWYDKKAFSHRIVNYSNLLPEEQKNMMVNKANEVVYMTVEYFGLCKTYEQPPRLEVIGELARTHLESGELAARNFLQSIRDTFQEMHEQAQLAKSMKTRPRAQATAVQSTTIIDGKIREP